MIGVCMLHICIKLCMFLCVNFCINMSCYVLIGVLRMMFAATSNIIYICISVHMSMYI